MKQYLYCFRSICKIKMHTFLLGFLWISTASAHSYPFYLSDGITYLNTDNNFGYRLPTTQIPSGYEISLTVPESVFTGTSTEFSGTTTISFSVTNDTKILLIHAPGEIPSSAIRFSQPGGPSGTINVSQSFFNTTTEILTITLEQNLTAYITYTVTMNYTTKLDTTEMEGFYRSTYVDENNVRQYLVTTQFEPTHARKAFPCFDEPSFKSTFQLSITHPTGTTALFNAANQTQISQGTMTTTNFGPSPRMSSYLVAFVVSKFTCSQGVPIATNVPHFVCSTPNSHNDRLLANEFSAMLMQSLENFTNIKYTVSGLNKMHQVAVPDFSAGAMENWGIVTYREMALLYNNISSSNVNKQTILTIIAHEFAHMWFGNLVTCAWWNTLFLNEGFATYFEYFIPGNISRLEIDENWQMARQFIIDIQQTALVTDGFNTSNALTSNAITPSQISGKFSTISYSKGGSVFRMIENFMETENFVKGVRNYLIQRQYLTALPTHLWEALQPFVPTDALPKDLTLKEVITNWIDTPGFPLVTVEAKGKDIHLSQKRFLYEGNSSNQWYVPVSYTLSNDTTQFLKVTPKLWLIPQNITLLPSVLENNKWIILNNQESAYYRVNYDESLWNELIKVLSNNHTIIDVINRAQIVDDALNLARAGEITYPLAFRVIDFLRNEVEYYPWVSAINGLDYLSRILGDTSSAGVMLQNLQRELIQSVRKNISFTMNPNNQIEVLKTRLILGRACRLNEPSCVENAKKIFNNYTNGVDVDRNLRTLVYCNGLRYSTGSNSITDWKYLWQRLQDTTIASEEVTILSALGCTKNVENLEYYLEQSINESSVIRRQDMARVWSGIVSASPEGIETAFSFFIKNWEHINAYDTSAASLLLTVTARLTTQEHLRRLKEFANGGNLSGVLKNIATSAVSSLETNIRLAYDTREQLEQHFVTDGIYLTSSSFIVILLLLLVGQLAQ